MTVKTKYRDQRMLPASSRRAKVALPVVVLVLIVALAILAVYIISVRRNEPASQQAAGTEKGPQPQPITKAENQQGPEQIASAEKGPSKQQTTGPQEEAVPQRREPARRPPGRRVPVQSAINIGQIAPDFELARLTIENTNEGKNIGKVSTKTVTLSSFRGKKPVFLIFSSYT